MGEELDRLDKRKGMVIEPRPEFVQLMTEKEKLEQITKEISDTTPTQNSGRAFAGDFTPLAAPEEKSPRTKITVIVFVAILLITSIASFLLITSS